MDARRPRELELAKVEVGILNECVGQDDAELAFLELHARTLLHHIQNARFAFSLQVDTPDEYVGLAL